MKILYVGVYRDSSGWSQAAIDYILALDAVGVEVIPRPIRYNNSKEELPKRILELESHSSASADVVIHHNLPIGVEYNRHFKKNIIAYCTETTNFALSGWQRNINMMDEAWVVSKQMKQASIESGVTVPIKVLPYSTNVEKFQRSYESIPQLLDAAKGSFVFYTIGAFHRRKNIPAILKAFHTEFDPDENVSLAIKTQGNPDEVLKACNDIKIGLKRFPKTEYYKQEIVFTDRMSELDILRLHNTADCYVSPSFGEAWCLPAFDAMGFGKTPIVTNWGGYPEFISEAEGWLVDYNIEPVFGMQEFGFANIYSSKESWASADVLHLRKCMREAYANKELRHKKAEAGMMKVYDFSYEIVGEQLKKAISDG